MTTASTTHGSRVLLLNGLWHGSWCWSEVSAGLAARGRAVATPDLAGHGLRARRPACLSSRPFSQDGVPTEGSPVAGISLDEAASLLTGQLRSLGAGAPVTVVAHSMSGAVLTRVAQESPELVARAVYLAAYMPSSDVPAIAYVSMSENEGELVSGALRADPRVIGALRLDTASDDVAYRDLLRQALYADVDPVVADAALGLLTPDAPIGFASGATTLTSDGWGSVPRTYIVCTEDRALRPSLQRKFIEDADATFPQQPTDVVTLESSHSPFLSVPERLVDVLDGLDR